jgi:hypothetical protein
MRLAIARSTAVGLSLVAIANGGWRFSDGTSIKHIFTLVDPKYLDYRRGMDASSDLTTTAEVMAALGGTTAVARLTNRKVTAASNWQSFDKFPANTFVVMTEALRRIGRSAPPSLWGMVERCPEPASTSTGRAG